jgi:hypothetical protein
MADKQRSCPLCNGSMHAGFLRDVNHKNPVAEVVEQMEWIAGDPGPVSNWHGGIKLAGRERHKVATFACTTCGYLQSFVQK